MMISTIATILGVSSLSILKNKIGSHSKKVVNCDEIRLDYTIRLNSLTTNLDHIIQGWSVRKFINKANIVEVLIKCVASEIDADTPEDYGEHLYAYFHVFVKLKGKSRDFHINDERALIIFKALKELWSETVLPFASDGAETEIQLHNNVYKNFYSISDFINNYNDFMALDIKASIISPNRVTKDSFYIADKQGNAIDHTLQTPSKLRRR